MGWASGTLNYIKLKKEENVVPSSQDIRSLRNRLYLTRDQFAELVGCSRSSIVNWELGRSKPREDYAARLNRMIMTQRVFDQSGRVVRTRISFVDKTDRQVTSTTTNEGGLSGNE